MATPETKPTSKGLQAAQILSVVCNLVVDACRSSSKQTLIFKILNNTVHLCHYDRAVLWDVEGSQPRLLGVSGQLEAEKNTVLARELGKLARAVPSPGNATILDKASFEGMAETWSSLASRTEGLSLLWLPIVSHGRLVAALWLERWGDSVWQESESKVAESLLDGYGAAWERHTSRLSLRARARKRGLRLVLTALLATVIVYFAGFRPQPLRLVAPCEIIPHDPFVVTAPLDGVVEEVNVVPGQTVAKGDLLFTYDGQGAKQELEVAEKQVKVIQAQFERLTAMAFIDEQHLSETKVLRHKLQQERLRLQLAERIVGQLEVYAKVSGVAMLGHPHEWRGRPVRIGERVVTIIDPDKTLLRVWLAENDNVGLDRSRRLDVFLHATPHISHKAKIEYVSPDTSLSPAGIPSFVVEAAWAEQQQGLRPGLKGTTILYGQKVSLAYWLLRKPWTAARRTFGW